MSPPGNQACERPRGHLRSRTGRTKPRVRRAEHRGYRSVMTLTKDHGVGESLSALLSCSRPQLRNFLSPGSKCTLGPELGLWNSYELARRTDVDISLPARAFFPTHLGGSWITGSFVVMSHCVLFPCFTQPGLRPSVSY